MILTGVPASQKRFQLMVYPFVLRRQLWCSPDRIWHTLMSWLRNSILSLKPYAIPQIILIARYYPYIIRALMTTKRWYTLIIICKLFSQASNVKWQCNIWLILSLFQPLYKYLQVMFVKILASNLHILYISLVSDDAILPVGLNYTFVINIKCLNISLR